MWKLKKASVVLRPSGGFRTISGEFEATETTSDGKTTSIKTHTASVLISANESHERAWNILERLLLKTVLDHTPTPGHQDDEKHYEKEAE